MDLPAQTTMVVRMDNTLSLPKMSPTVANGNPARQTRSNGAIGRKKAALSPALGRVKASAATWIIGGLLCGSFRRAIGGRKQNLPNFSYPWICRAPTLQPDFIGLDPHDLELPRTFLGHLLAIGTD